MGFFDLNIPYYESDKAVADKAARKTTRLKLIVKAMELGYTGVAYNRTIKGGMSEADRCATPLFPLSSVLKLAPSLSAAVKLHRDLLSVPVSAPFRQYTRLTVTVDSSSQASALNSGNPILKTYDIVAVRPLNQNAFEQACQASEVDLIAIDFSDKLPFRLKQPMVKAAIERGVYFEITYSALLMDAQVRRQMISNAKLLVDWTRGKNLIFSSAAPSVTELRGPYDVANLSSLLGLSMERAKAALSKNCRSLISNALRKRQCYKEAIRVEVISSEAQSNSDESSFSDWLKWDPISSGEGDLLLDDMARSFSVSTKASKTVKAIDFVTIMDSLPSHGLKVCVPKSTGETAMRPMDIDKNLSTAVEAEVSIGVTGVSQPRSPEAVQTSSHVKSTLHQTNDSEDFEKSFISTDIVIDSTSAEEIITSTTSIEERPKNSNGLDINFTPLETEMHSLQSPSHIMSCDADIILSDQNKASYPSATDTGINAAYNAVDVGNCIPSKNIDFSAFESEESKRSSSGYADLASQDHAMEGATIETNTKIKEDLSSPSYNVSTIETNTKIKEDLSSPSYNVSLHEDSINREIFRETKDDSAVPADAFPIVESFDEVKDNNDCPIANCEQPNEALMEEKKQAEDHSEKSFPVLVNSSGKGKVRQRMPNRGLLFPLKRLLNPTPFKRKCQKSGTNMKML